MVNGVVAHLLAHSDSRRLVEGPVNAQVDAALAVIFFRFGKAGESFRDKGADVALVILGDPVPLIRGKGEGEVVGPIEAPQNLEERPAKGGVTRRVGRERRCEVRAS
jgi:hypothetical protein